MKNTITKVLGIFLVFVLWHLASEVVNPLFLPKPIVVLNSFKDIVVSGQLLKGLWYSFFRILIASVLSASIAIPLGLLIYSFKFINNLIYPLIKSLRYVPVTAFYPLLIMWVGINEEMKVTFLFIATFLYMLPSVVLTLSEINVSLLDTAKTLGMGKIKLIYMVLLPVSLPVILQSFVMMFGIGWTYIPVVETINAKYGLGYIITQSTSRGRTDLVFVSIITIIIVSILFDNLATYLVKKVCKWRFLNDRT